MKKLITLLFLTVGIISTISCDDPEPIIIEPIQYNVFCYGDGTQGFQTTGGFKEETSLTPNGSILTPVSLLGTGLVLNSNDELEGNGPIIDMEFYGSSIQGFQSGTYTISQQEATGEVNATYSLDFDPSVSLNTNILLESGSISVAPYQNGYAIEINAIDSNGDEFHGIYLGVIPTL